MPHSISDLFPNTCPAAVPPDMRPILCVVIHTEEEFDWSRDFSRAETGVEHMRHIGRVQEIFEASGIVPTYVVDYPIASRPLGIENLRHYQDEGRALIGAHLHPWVSPPFREEVNAVNSYPGNLPADLEKDKLKVLTDTIHANFGRRPNIYLAGRYGIGPNSAAILESLGYEVDVSVTPPIDFSCDGGPDYSGISARPFWFGRERRLLALPGAGCFTGWLKALGAPLYRTISSPRLALMHLPAIMSRLRAFERLRLSPEGYCLEEMQRLTHAMLAAGRRIFIFSFHSPSVHPGFTPYVRDETDLRRFLATCRDYSEWFSRTLDGQKMTPFQIKNLLANLGTELIEPSRF